LIRTLLDAFTKRDSCCPNPFWNWKAARRLGSVGIATALIRLLTLIVWSRPSFEKTKWRIWPLNPVCPSREFPIEQLSASLLISADGSGLLATRTPLR
jgi:hypothetical protein